MLKHYYVREAVVKYRRTASTIPGRIDHSGSVASILRPHIGSNVQESLCVIAVDAKNDVLAWSEVARGGVAACAIDVRDIFRMPIVVGASGIVIAHNHPSGDPTPSAADIEFTNSVRHCSKFIGFTLLDHVIITELSQASFLDLGLL